MNQISRTSTSNGLFIQNPLLSSGCEPMTMQLSERAKQLIPQAKIVSFATWGETYSSEIVAIFQNADDNGRYLTDEDLEKITSLVPELSPAETKARLLREKASYLVANAREKVLASFPHITDPQGDLYPVERAEACWRDFWHFLRCVTYGIVGQNSQFTSQKGLTNMQLLYQELRVPLKPMIYGVEELKNLSLQQFDEVENHELTPYFDHLIDCLKDFEDS